jgi:hypothetical protein
MSASTSAESLIPLIATPYSQPSTSSRHVRTTRRRVERENSSALRAPSPSRNASRLEQLGVIAILSGIWCANGCHLTDTVTSCAVFLGFLHAQLSFDVAESIDDDEARRTGSNLRLLFMAKEGLWFLAFMAVQSWPLVFGSLLFSCYPLVRSRLRLMQRDRDKLTGGLKTGQKRSGAREATANRRGYRPHRSALRPRARSLRGLGADRPVPEAHRSPRVSPR